MPLEQVVRPIQNVDITPPPRTPPIVPLAPVDPVVLEFGRSGGSVFVASLASYSEFTTKEVHTEIERKVDVIRIARNDDPDNNYMDTESVRSVTIKQDSGKEYTVNYNPFGSTGQYSPLGPYTLTVKQKDVTIKNGS